MVTLKDLAQQLNLSVATVSRALAGRPVLHPATMQRVQALAAELGYRPNASAVGLRKGQSKLLGVIVPHLDHAFFTRVLAGIESAAGQAGYRIMLCQSNDEAKQEQQCLRRLLSASADGVLVMTARRHESPTPVVARARHVPMVLISAQAPAGFAGPVVSSYDQAGAHHATRHLLKQGYRRIAHVAGPPTDAFFCERRLGYEAALREHGLEVDPQLIVTGEASVDGGAQAAHQLLARTSRPDALFAASDLLAAGAMQALKSQGLRIPLDIGLVGFGSELLSQFTEPALTTIDQHGAALGHRATRLLLQLRAGRSQPEAALPATCQPSLLVRPSSAPRAAVVLPLDAQATASLGLWNLTA
ncbi:LacI family DNA-binding transcriptional regulator [Hymenobacter glacieicola]|uniref:LacI family transcriptional regulator n=1 Tax=Hymenobacter glacieicola TaxID=1562124 RepID=A0ABQ1WJ60_9BACT|nr:LacI family DNA-binding transcriptional regulator [Hymenobacter glacieicola]GGG33625.1 LacI family transcriptional regulator [Hymenobacter glacieicola]